MQNGKRIALIDRDPAWADRGGRRTNSHLIDINSTGEATEVDHDNQAAAELDALWAELEALMRPDGRKARAKR